ncbi:DUF2530 domain-containing protein [Streptomyces aidingensis]|uniref:DUF2530 domain-containing protein n=1 Tax=Streptomyces aidingensis TaxID=910347 RepID=A0A1I1HET2_9ACTN|nr:DUF2530 domain-containing protein [Streptomyces aidingensis]SFC22316.1 Protein of unknown function [Streptomyces aidingensis]
MRWADLTSGAREAPEPLEGNVIATVVAGTAVWAVLFLIQVPFHGRLADDGRGNWLWICLTGFGLGLFGLWYSRRREAALRAAARRESGAPADGPSPEGRGPAGTD